MNTLLSDPPLGELVIPDQQSRDTQARLAELDRAVHLSLIVPTYNEAKNIERVVRILSGLLEAPTEGRYELIVVDDDSPDETWKVAQSLMAEYPKLRVLRRQQERGLSTAVIRGWQIAQGEVLGVIDGDLQHPPETLLKLLQAINEGADLAVASRHVEGGGVSNWSLTRRILSRGAQMLGLMILPNVLGRITDPMSGYFMVRRRAVANKMMSPMGYKILLEVLGRGNVETVAEVGYVFQERLEGESKVTWKLYKDYLLHLAKLRSRGRISKIRRQFPLDRFLRFGLVGLSGVFVDMAVFYLLNDPTSWGWALSRSKIIAGEVAIINNFLWNDLWTFGDISSRQQGLQPRFRRFIKFNIVCLMGLILNVLLLNGFVHFLQLNPYLSNLLAIAIVTIWNFWINLKLSWRVTQVK
jgi:dolichol-phosphate mannosyltransferase